MENESDELKDSNIEGTEDFADLLERSESDVKCAGNDESPEKRRVDLQVMPVGEVLMENADMVNVQNLTKIIGSLQGDGRDDSHIIVSHSLGESLDVLDDSEIRQLIEIA